MQLNVCDGKIQFLNVNFCYKLELPILKNINLEIKSGQTVGIVGPTGTLMTRKNMHARSFFFKDLATPIGFIRAYMLIEFSKLQNVYIKKH